MSEIDLTAAAYLDALLDDTEPTVLPDETREWANAFLKAFREFRDGQRGKEAQQAAQRLGFTAAADPYRFFWEYWQNADDAGARELEFVIHDDKLTIANDGRPLSTFEVFSLLMVGGTTKDELPDQMGHFGVGSLSLMRFTDAPTYRSGQFAFTLERSFTYPATPATRIRGFDGGLFVRAPFRKDVDPTSLFEGLSGHLDGEALLYMRSLRRVTVRRQSGERRSVQANVQSKGPASIVRIGERTWNRFGTDVRPPAGLLRDGGRTAPDVVRIYLARDARATPGPSPVFVFFPTQVLHEYPWRFTAPLDVTTGREGILDGRFNRWLLREVGKAMVRAASDPLVGEPANPWDLVPAGPSDNPLLREVWSGALEEMRTVAWLPAGRRTLRASDAAFAESTEIRELLTVNDVAVAAGEQRAWISRVPSDGAQFALESAGAFRATARTLATILASGPKGKSPRWYLHSLAVCLAASTPADDLSVELLRGRSMLNRRGTPFSLLQAGREGRVVCSTRSEILAKELSGLFSARLVALLHREYRLPDRKSVDEADAWRRRIDEWLRNESSDETFTYENRLDAQAFIRLFIVERNMAAAGGDEADRLLSFVRDHMEAYVSLQGPKNRPRTLQQLGRALYMKAAQTDGTGKRISAYVPVADVLMPAGYLDRSSWPDAARSVPGLWWADARYRVRLVRKASPTGVTSFLRDLGAGDGPRLLPVPTDASHGVHQFSRVTRGDEDQFPNFPHRNARFQGYSDYGLRGDFTSPDLEVVQAHVAGLPKAERNRRGELLLRSFEEGWARRFSKASTAQAFAYYANSEYAFGEVPARWLAGIRANEWVATSDGRFLPPGELYARTRSTSSLLVPGADAVCRWEAKDEAVARELGFRTDVSEDVVLRYLRAGRDGTMKLTVERARAYYVHLARIATTTDLSPAFGQSLVFSPKSRRQWQRPSECLRTDVRSTLGTFVGYVDSYADARVLWDLLGVKESPDLEFMAAMWRRVAEEVDPADPELAWVLPRSYAHADQLVVKGERAQAPVPVIADGHWMPASSAFVTQSDQLAEALSAEGMARWTATGAELIPRLVAWMGMLDVDRSSKVEVLPSDTTMDGDVEARLHQAIASFAAEIHATQPALWASLGARLKQLMHGRVVLAEPLRLRVSMEHPGLGKRAFEVAAGAHREGGNLFISRLTQPADRAVVTAILSEVPVTGEARWAASNALQLNLMRETLEPATFPVDISFDADGSEPSGGYYEEESAEEAVPAKPPKGGGRAGKSSPPVPKPEPPPYPVDGYVVASDVGGHEDGEAQGGLVPRRPAENVSPGGGHGGGGGGGGGGGHQDKHSRRSTEQRGVDLYRRYVLAPAGIAVKDIRLKPKVGADLIGDDEVFRELKTHSGPAPPDEPLTEHEYVRAGNRGRKYELVVVESVWDEPVITVIHDPLRRLKYSPTGGVVVRGWRDEGVRPRVVRLGKGSRAR